MRAAAINVVVSLVSYEADVRAETVANAMAPAAEVTPSALRGVPAPDPVKCIEVTYRSPARAANDGVVLGAPADRRASQRNPYLGDMKTMVRLFVRHNVHDYAAWRKGYDAFEPTRIKLGAQGHAVYREVDDGNDVTVWHDFNSLEAAKAFAGSAELKAAMKGAGVQGAPTVWFTRHA